MIGMNKVGITFDDECPWCRSLNESFNHYYDSERKAVKEIEKLEAKLKRAEKLLKAVFEGTELGPCVDNVDGKCWFQVRNKLLEE